jgi:hypothetical protein
MPKLKKQGHRLLVSKFYRKREAVFGKGREEDLQPGQKPMKKNFPFRKLHTQADAGCNSGKCTLTALVCRP